MASKKFFINRVIKTVVVFCFFLLLLLGNHSFGQSKTTLLDSCFLKIPVLKSFEEVLHFTDTCQYLGIDSVVEVKGTYTSYKRQVMPFAQHGNTKVKALLKRTVYYDTATFQPVDTSGRYIITYYFNEGSLKQMDLLYKDWGRRFANYFRYDYGHSGTNTAEEWVSHDFKNNWDDNWVELAIVKGRHQLKGLYLSFIYDKRKIYRKRPGQTITIYVQ